MLAPITQRLRAPWTTAEGVVILLGFVLLFFGATYVHMLWVEHTIGFAAYLGEERSFPMMHFVFTQGYKAVAIMLVIWFLALKRKKISWPTLGFRPCHLRWLYWALALAAIAFVLRIGLSKILIYGMPEWAKMAAPPASLHGENIFSIALFLIMTVLITPVVEEIFFRGFLFQWMASRRPIWLAAIISAVMFGVSHIVPAQVISAIFAGLLIVYIFVASGSIWPAIVFHITNNALSISANLLAAHDCLPTWLTPPMG